MWECENGESEKRKNIYSLLQNHFSVTFPILSSLDVGIKTERERERERESNLERLLSGKYCSDCVLEGVLIVFITCSAHTVLLFQIFEKIVTISWFARHMFPLLILILWFFKRSNCTWQACLDFWARNLFDKKHSFIINWRQICVNHCFRNPFQFLSSSYTD